MSEANEVVDCATGIIRMLDIDRDFIYHNFYSRQALAQGRGQYYGWPDFVREALLSYAAEELS